MTEREDLRKTRDRSTDKSRARLFTELSVNKLKLSKDESEATYRDRKQQGLLLRINKSGSKSWRVQYYDTLLHRMRTEALGEFKPGSSIHVPVKKARILAGNHRNNLAEIQAARAQKALRNRDSFQTVSDWYIAEHVEGKRRSASQIKAIIKAVNVDWAAKPFEGITRPDVADLLKKIATERGPRAADVTLAVLRRMMAKHAVISKTNYSSVIVEGMAIIDDPKERQRTRVLSDQEIRLMFAACDTIPTFGNLCKMCLYTAQRRAKVGEMRFTDIDEEGVWTIPKERREKGNGERLKLPPAALAIIEAQRAVQTNEFVFPSSRPGAREETAFSAYGQAKAELDKAMAAMSKADIPHWIIHDLRRTARTLMSRAAVPSHTAERVMGHAIGGVEEVYDRHGYSVERASALQSLATLIGEILNPPAKGGNVVKLIRR